MSYQSVQGDEVLVRTVIGALVVLASAGCTATGPEWTPLFNGRDLTGWTPKIRGSAFGVDEAGTFRVEDGLITVGYEGYDEFGARFGHLFYESPFSHYRLKIEYRFVGQQATDGEQWAFKNSGVMFLNAHCSPSVAC